MEYGIVILATPILFGVSFLFRLKIFLPILCSIPAFVGYIVAIQKSVLDAFTTVLIWTFVQSILVGWNSYRSPERVKALILKSENYTQAMFHWIETGQLPEGSSGRVVWFHFQQTILYCALAIISANLGSLILGCILLNYMNFYVSQLARRSKSVSKAILMGWNFWSVVRVMAFLWLGVVLGIPMSSYVLNSDLRFDFIWLFPGIAGIVMDLIFKLTLSNWWRQRLFLLLR